MAEEIYLKDPKAIRKWLEKNYSRKEGIHLIYDKGLNRGNTWSQIVDELLCFGWIDSVAGKVDETRSKIYISPRNPKSYWSKINKDKVERLLAENKIHENGLRLINLAKESGTWDALNDVENLVIPKDLEKEFKKYKSAKANFENFSKSAKKMILTWILTAKRPETRLSRIQKTAADADKNVKAFQ